MRSLRNTTKHCEAISDIKVCIFTLKIASGKEPPSKTDELLRNIQKSVFPSAEFATHVRVCRLQTHIHTYKTL